MQQKKELNLASGLKSVSFLCSSICFYGAPTLVLIQGRAAFLNKMSCALDCITKQSWLQALNSLTAIPQEKKPWYVYRVKNRSNYSQVMQQILIDMDLLSFSRICFSVNSFVRSALEYKLFPSQ